MNNPNSSPGPNSKTPSPAKSGRAGRVLGYMFSPDLKGTVRPLKDSFAFFRMTLAYLFLSAGILPQDHPFFRPGVRFTLTDVFNETLQRFNWRDKTRMAQNIFFIAVWGLLASAVLWLMGMVLWLIAGAGVAHAATTPDTSSMFTAPDGDLAIKIIKALIEGEPITATADHPAGPAIGVIQGALRTMLGFFSSAVLVFASFILLYHIVNMVVAAAWSGKALQGPEQIWAPLRLVLAIMLLVPLAGGLNSAQLLTLKIAELGSGLATRTWQVFGAAFTTKDNAATVGLSNIRGIEDTVANILLIQACRYDINIRAGKDLQDLEKNTKEDAAWGSAVVGNTVGFVAGFSGYTLGSFLDGVNYVTKSTIGIGYDNSIAAAAGIDGLAYGYSLGQSVGESYYDWMIQDQVIGERPSYDTAKKEKIFLVGGGKTKTLCGIISFPGSADDLKNTGKPVDKMRALIQEGVLKASATLSCKIDQSAGCITAMTRLGDIGKANSGMWEEAYNTYCLGKDLSGNKKSKTCDSNGTSAAQPITSVSFEKFKDGTGNAYLQAYQDVTNAVRKAVSDYYVAAEAAVKTGTESLKDLDINKKMRDSSWVEAGSYFLQISAVQQAIMSASGASPKATLGARFDKDNYKEITQDSKNKARAVAAAGGVPETSGAMTSLQDKFFAQHLEVYTSFVDSLKIDLRTQAGRATTGDTGVFGFYNSLFVADKKSVINFFTGQGLSDPISALFSFGYDMFNTAKWFLGGGVLGTLFGGIPVIGSAIGGIASVSIVIGFLLLGISIPLAFILPVLPLAKFIAAFMSWLIGVFEAVVAMPFFALAHLTPKGNTLFEPATKGYHFLFHILLKPVLLVFGMIGVIIVLPLVLYAHNLMYGTALNIMWTDNFDFLDKFMFFLAYAGTAYGFVNASFKAIDDLSSKALGWANISNYSFRDDSEATSSQAAFAQYATTVATQSKDSVSALSKGIGGSVKEIQANAKEARETSEPFLLKKEIAKQNREAAARDARGVGGTTSGGPRIATAGDIGTTNLNDDGTPRPPEATADHFGMGGPTPPPRGGGGGTTGGGRTPLAGGLMSGAGTERTRRADAGNAAAGGAPFTNPNSNQVGSRQEIMDRGNEAFAESQTASRAAEIEPEDRVDDNGNFVPKGSPKYTMGTSGKASASFGDRTDDIKPFDKDDPKKS